MYNLLVADAHSLILTEITSTYLIPKCKQQSQTQNPLHLLSKSCSENSQKEMLSFSTTAQTLGALTQQFRVPSPHTTSN